MRAQALAQLTEFFPSVPASAIAGALGKAGGNVEQAADLLFKAAQARPACTVGTRRASPPTSGRQCAVGTHMCAHRRTSLGAATMSSTQAVVPRTRFCTPRGARTHADARRGRVSHRAPALRPHLAHQIPMRIRCAHNLEQIFFRHFPTPKIWVGVGPSPGFAVLPFVLVWQARKAVANKKAVEVAAPVRPHTGYVGLRVSVALQQPALMCSSATTFHSQMNAP